ncbi:MAG: hypothetical protein WD100_00435 [Tistlia sp.]
MSDMSENPTGSPAGSPEASAAAQEAPDSLAPDNANFATERPDVEPEADPAPAPEQASVPERYELAMPEGMALDEAMLSEFTPVARALGLDNEQAQSLADAYARRMQAMAAGRLEGWNRESDRLAEAVLADPEIGGGESAFAAKRTVMKRGLAALGDRELARAIEEGRPIHPNSPGLLRALYRLGRAAREDGFAEGGLAAPGAATGPQSWARSLYPSLTTAKE